MSRSRSSGRRGDAPSRPRMRSRHTRDDPDAFFRCGNCRRMVSAVAFGTKHRNHCPMCLWSRHVDDGSGDRASDCGGRMEPIAIWVQENGEWSLVHRCVNCRALKSNRIAGDDNEFVLMSLATRAIAFPPFPLEPLGKAGGGGEEEEC